MRKRLITCTIFATLFICLTLGIGYYNNPTNRFTRATQQLFCEEMLASTLNMHYTLANPGDFGIKDYQAVLPCYDSTDRLENISALEKQITFYESLDVEKLSAGDNHTRNLLLSCLHSTLDASRYPYHEEPLSPSSGMQSQLPILLAEYPFRTILDVEDYLAILSQTGDYFASLLTFEKEKKDAGLLMAATSLYDTAEQCGNIITEAALKKGEHFLQITFAERLQELCDQKHITAEEAHTYTTQNNDILMQIVLPAYKNLAEGLTALADPSIPLAGLGSKPDGAAYYEILLRSETGSCRSMDEIRELLANQLQAEYLRFGRQLQTLDPVYLTESALETCNDLFPINTCAAMLTDLQAQMKDLFPNLPNTDVDTPVIHVKEVSPCLQDYCAPAFYLTPPIDDSVNNSIYINPKTTITSIDLYTTLAHEGFPGHLYQTVYCNQQLANRQTTPVEQILWFGGYLEGWALYVEFMAYDYASAIMLESGYPQYAELLQVEKYNRSTQLCIYTLLDLLIHYDNLDYQGTAEFLEDFGITNSASVNHIYEYIVEEPANYPKYYLGYLEILLLKEACQEAWGEEYSDYAFHKFFLDYGPADFGTLKKLVDEL